MPIVRVQAGDSSPEIAYFEIAPKLGIILLYHVSADNATRFQLALPSAPVVAQT
jgi:hypothetical protein